MTHVYKKVQFVFLSVMAFCFFRCEQGDERFSTDSVFHMCFCMGSLDRENEWILAIRGKIKVTGR